MKLLLPLLFLLFAVCTPAAAADLSSIELSVELANGPKVLVNAKASTLNGQLVPINISKEHTYVANATKEGNKITTTPGVVYEGFWMTLTPTLMDDGRIELEFVSINTELISINKFKQGDLEIELPQVSKITLKRTVILDDGKEITIPTCSVTEPSEAGKAACNQYTLKLIARAI